jgi:hypothetical protein
MWAKRTNKLHAYLKQLEAYENLYLYNKESNTRTRQLAKEAIDLDPQFASAYMSLGKMRMRSQNAKEQPHANPIIWVLILL